MGQPEQTQRLEELKERLANERPAPWDSLPDLPLYMDQVVSYLGRQLITFGDGDLLTSAMINNYIKDGIVPRANGKRYEREHLAGLTAVAALKQVLSVRDMGTLIENGAMKGEPRESYEHFRAELDLALRGALEDMEDAPDCADLASLAMTLALRSYADALACRHILNVLRAEAPAGERDKKKKK